MRRIALVITLVIGLLTGDLALLSAPWSFAAPSNGLRGDYFVDTTLTTLALSRVDPTVNFNWQTGMPASGLRSDQFTVRWTGQVIPRFSETYTFRITADDGARLWINGQLVIDAWSKAYGGVNSTALALKADQGYALKLEYREQTGGAAIKLEWSSRSQPLQIIPQSQLVPAGATTSTPTNVPPMPTNMPTAVPPAPTSAPKLLFGIGAEADSAIEAKLTTEAPVHMLTSWYNGPNDLTWMSGWKTSLVPRAYAAGYNLHLVVFSDNPELTFATKYGTACGRPYPLSDRFLGDMRQLAQTFAGTAQGPALYVTLFTEFQTYACKDNAWNADAQSNAYYRALKDRYLETLAVFHQNAPNAKVSLGWGGWQTRFDAPTTGGGRSMFQYFDDVMRASDFQSIQAMQSDSNVSDVQAMTHVLGVYGPVMLAHYKPNNGSAVTFDSDLRAMLTDAYLSDVTAAGLFAWSFMDTKNLDGAPATYQFVKDAVSRYGTAAK
ncbi:MAG TPA: PA14 domain-containing protein [Roseiflexaceae bacterium]|nr:PA14 domain-containing protein [Roseiflexaceae bacterium]